MIGMHSDILQRFYVEANITWESPDRDEYFQNEMTWLNIKDTFDTLRKHALRNTHVKLPTKFRMPDSFWIMQILDLIFHATFPSAYVSMILM